MAREAGFTNVSLLGKSGDGGHEAHGDEGSPLTAHATGLDCGPKLSAVEVAQRIRVFVGSSSEGEGYGIGVVEVLAERPKGDNLDVQFWKDAFKHSGETVIEGLLRALDSYDFAVMLLTKDDILDLRGQEVNAPRDNVIFELGLFVGRLGRDRAFLLVPNDFDIRLPSDLLGVVVLNYAADALPDAASVRSAAYRARDSMLVLGRRRISEPVTVGRSSARRSKGDDGMAAGRPRSLRQSSPANVQGASANATHAAPAPTEPTWTELAGSGWLENIRDSDLSWGVWAVHTRWGLGRVVEVGPLTEDGRIVCMRFNEGGEGQVRASELFNSGLS